MSWVQVRPRRGIRVTGGEGEVLDLSVDHRQLGRDGRASRLFNPRVTPHGQVFRRALVEDGNEIRPGGVAELVLAKILAQSVSKRVGSHDGLELSHDDRRFLINDRAVQCSGILEVVERLTDGVRAGGSVDVVGERVIRVQKPQVVIHARKRRIDDLRRHEVGEDLLHPHVGEPAHRHEIAEPHVRRLV